MHQSFKLRATAPAPVNSVDFYFLTNKTLSKPPQCRDNHLGNPPPFLPAVCYVFIMAEPSKFRAILNSGYIRFLSISDCREELELLFSAELKTNCFNLNIVYKMYLSYNFE